MQRAASYPKTEADQSRTYALIGSLLLLGLSYVLLLAAPIVSKQLRSFAGGHANLGAIESWLPAACVSGLVLGGGAALMFVLVQIAREVSDRGIPVLISNHATHYTRGIYAPAERHEFPVRRFISCNGQRRIKTAEVLALFS